MDGLGQWREKIEDIENVISSFYKELFTSTSPSESCIKEVVSSVGTKITEEMNRNLVAAFKGDEVLVAVNQMDPLKALGPDGLLVLFFQKFWDVVGDGVTKAVLVVLNDNAPLNTLREAIVVLIPKVKLPVRVSEFRPISLCNVVYTLVAKVLANRLKGILDKVISPNQSAFGPGRDGNKNCSMGGRENLVKAVAQAVPTYTMSCFRSPASVVIDLHKLFADF
ncbi:hypothetical protein Dsin_021288 [Dipteronia sinensis]|uniref:Reverse transcriptase domain-containing protein n=1 Tax=Dipteronia sinensis TaxID=43782 RepID=A0AAE0DYN0_9ROSI|nr:hypothetical protein Dsin_021288 [Dipteronia sinensis]